MELLAHALDLGLEKCLLDAARKPATKDPLASDQGTVHGGQYGRYLEDPIDSLSHAARQRKGHPGESFSGDIVTFVTISESSPPEY